MSRPGLSFGVTGHRNFGSDDGRLTGLVATEMRRAIAELQRQADAKGAVVSALAEGADRLVARVGLDQFGFDLVAALPMPVDAYSLDFGNDASKAEFAALLARTTARVDAPILSAGDGWRQYTEARNHQYAWAGAYLVTTCDVLIALWDGKPARGTGGTAHVVDWFRDGRSPERYGLGSRHVTPDGPAKARRLIHIVPESGDVRRQDFST
ncbi:MAG: hypothetical protein ACKVP7_28410 [Hyphomicrobiaceae bacterium]